MGEMDIRVLEDTEHRSAHELLRAALHNAPVPDQQWAYTKQSYEPGRALGAFVNDVLVGTAHSFWSSLALPGGATVPMMAVARVGVRADHTRRGVLTGLMRAQLEQAAERGEVIAGLHASEAVIYGRFGYGVGTVSRTLRVRTRETTLRPDVPVEGEVRLLDGQAAIEALPRLYERLGPYRPGVLGRAEQWWKVMLERAVHTDEYQVIAVHSGEDGDDGFVVYQPEHRASLDDPGARPALKVTDFHAATPAAATGLWRFLLGVDLVEELRVLARPTDEPIEEMLVDRRACTTQSVYDDLWLRLVDVPAALDARSYGDADSVVVEIADQFLPGNSGRYRISPEGAERTSEPAQLIMDVATLAMVYLGRVKPSALAGIGRVGVADPDSPANADRLFASDTAPYCGTFF